MGLREATLEVSAAASGEEGVGGGRHASLIEADRYKEAEGRQEDG